MALLYHGSAERGEIWGRLVAEQIPEIEFRRWPDVGNANDVRYLAAWAPPSEVVHALPNLEVLFSVGAGVDQLALDRLPAGLRVVRMVEPGIVSGMAEYVTMAVLALHRDLPFLLAEQRAGRWTFRAPPLAAQRTVGIMGLGELGRASLDALKSHGFKLTGWSRSSHEVDGVECFAGDRELPEFLAQAEILVCLLPLTPETRGILSRETFARLPHGAMIVNAARGGHLNDTDLIEALASGQVRAAVLDVTEPEPLTTGHPFYEHPGVILTPHVASVTRSDSAGAVLIDNLRRLQSGRPLIGEIDLVRGY